MKSIIQSLWCFIILLRLGYRLSSNTHTSSKGRWGFIRLNHKDQYSIIDIDFDHSYSHIHGDCTKNDMCMINGTIFRYQPK